MSVYSNLVIADGASSFWRLNEPSGTTAVDVIGGKNGTISGGVTLNQQGALGDGDPAMAFNGTTGKIVTVAGTRSAIFTFEVWIKTTTTTGDVPMFCMPLFTGHDLWSFRISNGKASLVVYDRNAVSSGLVGLTKVVADGQWHHLVYVCAGGLSFALYVDSVIEPTGTNLLAAPLSDTQAFQIGFDGNSTLFWPGSLDDVAIYPVALSPAQIAAHYQARLLSGSRRPLPAFVLAHRRFPS